MRLIDADALKEEMKKDIMGGLNYEWYINNAPTVDVLDKIRTEIWDGLYGQEEMNETNPERAEAFNNGLNYCIDIIDKYRQEG